MSSRVASWATWVLAAIALMGVVVAISYAGITRVPIAVTDHATMPGGEQVVSPDPQPQPEPELPPELPPSLVSSGPWVPGTTMHLTTDYPQPGVSFHVSECTVAFSFRDEAGAAYAVTASHCGQVGDLVWPTTASTMEDYATEVGRVIYSDLQHDTDIHNDIGIIAISDDARPMTFAGDATQANVISQYDPERVEACKIGGTTQVTCGQTGPVEQQHLYNENGDFVVTQGRVAEIYAERGDSGGPVVADGVVIGLVSGTRSPDEQGTQTLAYTPASLIIETIQAVIPTAQLQPAG